MRLGSVQGEQERVGIRLKIRKQDVAIGSVPGVPRPLAGAYMTEVEAEPGLQLWPCQSLEPLDPLAHQDDLSRDLLGHAVCVT